MVIYTCRVATRGRRKFPVLSKHLTFTYNSNSDYDGRCALHLACAEDREELVHLLLKHQADLHQTDNFQNNALSSALLHGHFKLAKYIFKKGLTLL